MDPVAEIEAFLDALERHYGCRPVIYTTPEYHAAFLANRLPNERFWVRSIHLPPMFRRDSWVLWQYHHAGRRDGVEGPLDLNVFRGSKEAFWRFAREAGCKG
jgi:lysozyme